MNFEDIKQLNQKEPTFFASLSTNVVRHFLHENGFHDFEIITKKEALKRYGENLNIPDNIRLTPTAPRIETRPACLISTLNPPQALQWIQELHDSDEAIAYGLNQAFKLTEELKEGPLWQIKKT